VDVTEIHVKKKSGRARSVENLMENRRFEMILLKTVEEKTVRRYKD